MNIPLFLLNTVLYSGGRLDLRVFEPHYMEMVKECLRTDSPFGVCLLESGQELTAKDGPPTLPHRVGTLAKIVDWDMPQLGILHLVTHGKERFRILDTHIKRDGLVRAEVELLPDPPIVPIPSDFARLVPMLRALIEAMEDPPPAPHRFFSADWLADRWAELLPLPLITRQHILEIDDGVARLEAIYRFLEQASAGGGPG